MVTDGAAEGKNKGFDGFSWRSGCVRNTRDFFPFVARVAGMKSPLLIPFEDQSVH